MESDLPLKIAVTTQSPEGDLIIDIEGEKFEPTLGETEAVAVRLDEMVRSIAETIGTSIQAESELTVEISGGISLSAKGGAKWLFFNVGGGAEKTDTLKVVLKTKIKPHTD